MKKILLGTALAGMIVGTFTSLSFAASAPARMDDRDSTNIVQVDAHCGPHRHFVHGFRDRYGRFVPGHCVRNYDRGYERDRGYYYR